METDKIELIKSIEEKRDSRVISYITGGKPPFSTRVADDVVPILGDLLNKMGKVNKISLFLYTNGGSMLTPIRIVKIIRNYCDNFEVLVPYKAQSAGTLICIGADKIAMGRLGELTPVDPTTGHPFNPKNPQDPNKNLEISVEDLNSYLLFTRDEVGVKDEQMIDAYKLLVEKLHPLSIGNAYRAYRMSRSITERLLLLHMDKERDEEKLKKIVKEITSDITIHSYPIDRDEAFDIGLKVEKVDNETENYMRSLYSFYDKEINLSQPFSPTFVDGKDMTIEKTGAFLESTDFSSKFVSSGKASKVVKEGKPFVDINISSQSWIINK
ncbi:MAG: hypothetical protein WDZ80_01060 [Candidatus Paceibacterota bacterium]